MNSNNYPIFKARCSAIGEIMSDPKSGSPMDKYLKKVKSIQDNKIKYEAMKNKDTPTAVKLWNNIQRREFDELPELEAHKDDILLSATCVTHLDNWIKEKYYHRRKQLRTNAIQKGIECESEAIVILNKALGTSYKKAVYNHGERMENEWCTGHEDIDGGDHIIDTKVCETFDTFPILKEEVSDSYWWQGQGYMMLKGEQYKKHSVAKVLVNSPAWQIKSKLWNIYNETQKKYEDYPDIAEMEYDSLARQLFLGHVFDQQLTIETNGGTVLRLEDHEVIPYEKRVNVQTFHRDDEAIESIKARVELCRQYLHKQGYKQRED